MTSPPAPWMERLVPFVLGAAACVALVGLVALPTVDEERSSRAAVFLDADERDDDFDLSAQQLEDLLTTTTAAAPTTTAPPPADLSTTLLDLAGDGFELIPAERIGVAELPDARSAAVTYDDESADELEGLLTRSGYTRGHVRYWDSLEPEAIVAQFVFEFRTEQGARAVIADQRRLESEPSVEVLPLGAPGATNIRYTMPGNEDGEVLYGTEVTFAVGARVHWLVFVGYGGHLDAGFIDDVATRQVAVG